MPEGPGPPVMALRTYGFLRLGMVGVIVALAVSVITEVSRSDGCFQRSISAYYYTPVRSVFVGALVALGLAMIALWGRNPVEDAGLNLAGMLAPVVAFVPTSDANYCSVVTSSGTDLTDVGGAGGLGSRAAQTRTDQLIDAAHDAVFNNVITLLVIIGGTFLIIGIRAARGRGDQMSFKDRSFVIPFVTALIVWAVGLYFFTRDREAFYEHAHMYSAILLFAFIIGVVLASAFDSEGEPPWTSPFDREHRSRSWRMSYFTLGALMLLAAAVIPLYGAKIAGEDTWLADHWVFTIEATLIGLFGVFWVLQSIQRAHEGAPRTRQEAERLQAD